MRPGSGLAGGARPGHPALPDALPGARHRGARSRAHRGRIRR